VFFDVAQDDPELVEGSKDEPFCSWFDKLTTSEVVKRFGRSTLRCPAWR
jgi:hypothetical protein